MKPKRLNLIFYRYGKKDKERHRRGYTVVRDTVADKRGHCLQRKESAGVPEEGDKGQGGLPSHPLHQAG